MKKFPEARIYDMAITLLEREMEKLQGKGLWIGVDYTGFEKLAKVYCLLKDDLRDDTKADIWSKLQTVSDA